ncbi:MAG: cysteine desulfurase [Oscillospiraceae bacterium]|nr:cysteine desulfurase [Oscillospiraceae bacterium]
MIYFDNAATTKPCPEAVAAMTEAMTECYGNPSAGYFLGREAAKRLKSARDCVAAALGAKGEEIFFTSGGTESDNWALRGAAKLMRHKGKHIITSKIEHEAILKTAEALESEGYEVTYLDPDKDGRISAESVKNALREDTILVSVMLVNNETGAVNPIRGIADELKGSGALLHTDAVQAFLKVPFSARTLGADLISVSSHKIHGPKGAGALYIRSGLRLPSILTGGEQEASRRPGTEATPAIFAFGAAAEAGRKTMAQDIEKTLEVKNHTLAQIRSRLPGVLVLGASDAPHILNISLPGYKSEVLMNFLEAEGICVSKSSACRRGARSHVLEAMRLRSEVIDGAIRLSFSQYNTPDEGERFAEVLASAAERLRTVKR